MDKGYFSKIYPKLLFALAGINLGILFFEIFVEPSFQVMKICIFTLIIFQLGLFQWYKKENREHIGRLWDTGLKGRLSFQEALEDSLESMRPTMLVAVDIDSFKSINNLWSHEECKELLQQVAKALSEDLGSEEGCYHIKKDVFYMILFVTTEKEDKKRIKDKLDKLSCLYRDKKESTIFFSAGICYLAGGASKAGIDNIQEKLAMLEENANFARKSVKHKNYNSIAVYQEGMDSDKALAKKLEASFLLAVENREFQIVYQPKYAYSRGQKILMGAEALVRWESMEMGLLSPSKFVPVFSRDGNAALLDMYVTETVCRQIRDWLSEGYEVKPISVNVSRNTISEENDYLNCVRHMLGLYEISSNLLEFEILESSSEQGEEEVVRFINKFHQNGYRVAVDDFGTGYSSLGLLNKIKFDVLKLDKSFFSEWSPNMDKKQTAIVRNILHMARELEVKVIAEGIEDKYQVELLEEMGCDMIQGYYFSKPLAPEEFVKLLSK